MSLKHVLVFCQVFLTVSCAVISTPNGNIRGYSSDKTDVYLGIPYGEIPARWLAAREAKPWNSTYNATSFGPICPQYGPFKLPGPAFESEDCLFLNIWVPKPTTTANSLLPVRLWLHGGGYTAGRSDDYDAENLAYLSQSIIVTLNYRLGIFSFFPLPNITDRNLGWLDQQLALKWIQANIDSFRGDKTNVMIFGQSAGGGSSIAHLLLESSWPLYSSVILESPGPFRLPICVEKEKVNWQFLQQTFPQCQSNLTCYQNLNTSSFYEKFSMYWISLWPCIGEQSQLLEQPITLLRKGQFNRHVNILAGFNSNEGQSPTFIFNENNMTITSDRYFELADQYEIPSDLTHRYDPTTTDKNYFNALSWLLGDYLLNCPILYLFNHTSATSSSSIYAYMFIHPIINWAFTPLNFNATHLTEIPFVFQNQFALTQLTNDEVKLSTKIIELFTSFHQSKQPWPTYQNNQTIILFDLQTTTFRNGFDENFIERCSYLLKYMDSTDCHGYFTRNECLSIQNCQWIDEHCESRKIREAEEHIRNGEKYMKTSFLKWKPDLDSAIDEFEKACTCYRVAEKYEQCRDLSLRVAELQIQKGTPFFAGKSYEQAAQMTQQLKDMPTSAKYFDRAGQLYVEGGYRDSAAILYERCAPQYQQIDRAITIDFYLKAARLAEQEDKAFQVADLYEKAAMQTFRTGNYQQTSELFETVLKILTELERFDRINRVVLYRILLKLFSDDSVAARNIFNQACQTYPSFEQWEERIPIEALLDAFDQEDQDLISQRCQQPFFMAIDPEFVRLLKRWIRPAGSNKTEQPRTSVPTSTGIKPIQIDDDEDDLR